MNIEPRLPQNRQDISPEKIAGLLSIAAEQLDRDTADALCRARHAALDRQAISARTFALNGIHGLHWPIPHTPRQWAATLLLMIIVGSASYWQHLHQHEMATHLDVAILTDDMPLEVFIDHRTE